MSEGETMVGQKARTGRRCVAVLMGIVAAIVVSGCAHHPLRFDETTSFAIEGDVAAPSVWDAARIRSEFPDAIRTVEHQTKSGTYSLRALPLALLVRAAEPRFDEGRKNHALAFAVVCTARDGYAVTFALEEVDPYKAEPTILIAFAEESGPFPESIGPARLVIPGAMSGSRSLHAIRTIRVVDLAGDGR